MRRQASTGATDHRVTVEGVPQPAERVQGLREGRLEIPVALAEAARTVEVTWRGGLTVAPPTTTLTPGQESEGLRVMDLRHTNGGWTLDLEGTAGRTYEVALHGTLVRTEAPDVGVVERANGVTRLRVRFPAGSGRRTVSLALTPVQPEPRP